MNNLNHSIEKNDFEAFIHAIGFEIEHAQVKLIVAANTQMLFHYWKLGHFIRYYQTKLGWGGKVINKISQTIKMNYPEKKGYSARNLTYMCQFARLYPLKVLQNMLSADVELEHPTIATVLSVTKQMDNLQITQELPAQFAAEGNQSGRFTQEAPAQIPSEGNQSGRFTQELPAQFAAEGNQSGRFTQEAPAQIPSDGNQSGRFTQEVPAQIAAKENQSGEFTQEAPAQIPSEGNQSGEFTQEAPAQIPSDGNQPGKFTQELPAQIQEIDKTISLLLQTPIEEIEKIFIYSPISKINWASHLMLLDSSLSLGVSYWYMKQSVEMGWSSTVLKIQIENNLFKRQIAAQKVSNFTSTLPPPQSDLAHYLLKDSYIFDLAGVKEQADEREIEKQLIEHVTKYLLEMGNGFAFVAKQKHFQVGNSDFYADLILYNIKLHAYIVAELKATPFKPEYAGQLNFYINVVDDQMRGENDNNTIGLLLCKGKDEVVAQYALTGYAQPIGVSDYQLSKAIPENLKSALPSLEEVEEELSQLLDNKMKG